MPRCETARIGENPCVPVDERIGTVHAFREGVLEQYRPVPSLPRTHMMRFPVSSTTTRRGRLIGVIGLIAAVLASPLSAWPQHRAQLDPHLADAIARDGSRTFSVIVDGPQSEMDRVARAYGLHIVKRLDSGALLTGTGAQ